MARTGRPRAFDEDRAVADARDLFWSRGYGATSVQDLVDVLGLHRGSLYGAFGDKRSLYLRAVARYVQENRRELESMLAAGPVLPVLRQILAEPATLTGPARSARSAGQVPRVKSDAPLPARGCLVGNTTAELVPGDEEARTLVAAAYDGFIEVVAAALRRAQASGEVTATATPEEQAQLLLVLFQGAALIARADSGGRARIIAGLDAALAALRANSG